jgi:TolB-like protein/Tfp pilus assembly protein PilF
MGLVSELRRRNVFRMAVLYVVAAWLIMQVGEVLVTLAALPSWTGKAILALLAIGFPIALIFSWFYELTPEGVTLEKDVGAAESITHVTGRRMDFIVISLLCAAVLLFAYDKWWTGPPTDKSIAVLAFKNMSGDPDQEYFSDGISEELLNLLSKVPELRVISRASAFSFKGKDIATPVVAEQLNVAHVLDGSVRREGDRVRITAQIIEARSDSHLWSETYDRSFEDIFGIQDEIAAAVVEQLKIRLLSDPPKVHEIDADAYKLFLQGRYLINQGSGESYQAAAEILQQAIAIDAHYAAAWAELGRVYINQILFRYVERDDHYTKAIEALDTALTIDPEHAESLARLAWARQYFESDFDTAAELYERALALEPGNAYALTYAASLLRTLGRNGQAIKLEELAQQRDPLNSTVSNNLAVSYLIGGRLNEAEAMSRRTILLSPEKLGARVTLARVLFHKGDLESALLQAEEEPYLLNRLAALAIVHHALGNQLESKAALDTLIDEHQQAAGWFISLALVLRGDTEEALDWMEKSVETAGPQPLVSSWFALEYQALDGNPRWEKLLTRAGVSQQQLARIQFDVPLTE